MLADSKLALALFASYALILASPGPNLFVVLRASLVPSPLRPIAAAIGLACGASIAAGFAAYCATFVLPVRELEVAATLVFSAVLIRSAARLYGERSATAAADEPVKASSILKLFGLGLFAALTNPVTFSFFVSFFVANPAFQRASASACVIVFLMVAFWFSSVGVIFAKSAARGLSGREGLWFRKVLATLMVGCALLPLGLLLFD